MPFVVPKVTVYGETTTTAVVDHKSNPTAEALAAYIDWLDSELEIAKTAYAEKTGNSYEPNRSTTP